MTIVVLGQLAVRNIVRQKRRALAATIAVTFGVVAYILAGGFIDNLIWGMSELTIKAHLGHVQIMRSGYLESGAAAPFDYLVQDNLEQRIKAERDIVVVAPRLAISGLVSRGETTQSFVGDGVDPAAERFLSTHMKIMRGQNLSAEEPNGVILGDGLATSMGAQIGDRVVLVATTRSGGVNAVEVKVLGTFSTITKAYDDMGLRIPLKLAQQLLKVSGTHKWVVLLDDTTKTQDVVSRLSPMFNGSGLDVVPWTDLADFYNKTVSLFKRQVGVMRLIIAAIIMLSITNTMMMSVMERTGEIGTTMALGRSRRDVLLGFVLEGLLLGAVGAVIGIVAGVALAVLITFVGIPMPPPPGMAQGFTAGILASPRLVIEALALALITTLLAAIYPSWKASRLVIVDALRHNR